MLNDLAKELTLVSVFLGCTQYFWITSNKNCLGAKILNSRSITNATYGNTSVQNV